MNLAAVQPLIDLGFTELEARVYLCLLKESPLTGYAVAKAIGKAAANTYQAIESLARKSAVLIDEGENRMCRAVAPQEVLGGLEREFKQRRLRAQRAVHTLHRRREDQRIYQLRSPEQAFDRAADMIDRGRRIVMVDAFPAPLERLAESLTGASRRGVLVCVHAYQAIRLEGVEVRHSATANYALTEWPGSHLSVAVDAEQHLYALLSADLTLVTQAVWSESLYLSCIAHNHLATEFELAELRGRQESVPNPLPIHLVRDRLPGFEKLCSRESSVRD